MATVIERKKYKNPPIEEALVDFRMAPSQEWDPTIPGKLHEKLKSAYPGKPRQQQVVQASIKAVRGQPMGFSLHESGRVMLVDAEGRRLLSLGPDALSVNVLRPYDGWEHFRSRINAALHSYIEVSDADKVSRIDVRYVNRVVVPSCFCNIESYFVCWPSPTPGLPSRVGGFLNRAEYVYDDGVKLATTFGTIEAAEGSSAFLLDVSVALECAEPIDVDNALSRVEDLHEREWKAFEALITDKTREIFDA